LLGFQQTIFGGGQFYRGISLARVVGTFVGPNAFAIYLVMILAVFVVQMFGQSKRVRIWSTLIALSSGILLVQTFTRVAWIGAAIVILTIGLLRERRLLALLPLAAVIAFVTVPEITGRVSNPLGGTFADRVAIWRGSYAAWLHLTSLGGGFLTTLLDRLSGLGPGARYALVALAEGRTIGAHNDYLGILYDFGVMGLVSYIVLLWILTITAYRAWRRTRDDPALSAVPLSFLALVLAYWVMSLTDNLFGMTVNQVYFWSLAGLTVGLDKVPIEEVGPESRREQPVTPPLAWNRPPGLSVTKGLAPRP
jgi:O-antigen ligase